MERGKATPHAPGRTLVGWMFCPFVTVLREPAVSPAGPQSQAIWRGPLAAAAKSWGTRRKTIALDVKPGHQTCVKAPCPGRFWRSGAQQREGGKEEGTRGQRKKDGIGLPEQGMEAGVKPAPTRLHPGEHPSRPPNKYQIRCLALWTLQDKPPGHKAGTPPPAPLHRLLRWAHGQVSLSTQTF